MEKVKAKERYLKICDYITPADIISKLDSFMCEEDLHDFCDFLIEEFDIDIEEDYEEEYSDYDNYEDYE